MARPLPVLLLMLVAASACPAQEWAAKMFTKKKHDFGTVARGSQAQYAFEFENLYEEDIHIASVRSSCGCTTPSVTKKTLKTFETAHVIAKFNTRSFVGNRSATLTVVIDKPYYAEVPLAVSGFIRSDVVFRPGSVNFGEVEQFESPETRVEVQYAGRSSWQIVDVRSGNNHFEVELIERQRARGRVTYDMRVRLRKDAPAGYIQDQLIIVSDDSQQRTIPLAVTGRVVSPLTVSPASLLLGAVEPGETVTKQLVVRAKKPFKVVDVECDDDCFDFKLPTDVEKRLHFIPVTFTAGEKSGSITKTIVVTTDLGTGAKATCTATATIKQTLTTASATTTVSR